MYFFLGYQCCADKKKCCPEGSTCCPGNNVCCPKGTECTSSGFCIGLGQGHGEAAHKLVGTDHYLPRGVAYTIGLSHNRFTWLPL